MSVEQLDLFYKFAKHHTINFLTNPDGSINYSYYCSGIKCDECVLAYDDYGRVDCGVQNHGFTDEEIEQIRNKFPESLI